jgi:hypothetical protein
MQNLVNLPWFRHNSAQQCPTLCAALEREPNCVSALTTAPPNMVFATRRRVTRVAICFVRESNR